MTMKIDTASPALRRECAIDLMDDIAEVFSNLPDLQSLTVNFTSHPIDDSGAYSFDVQVLDAQAAPGSKDAFDLPSMAELMVLTEARFHEYLRPVVGAKDGQTCDITLEFLAKFLPKTIDDEALYQAFIHNCPDLAASIQSELDLDPVQIQAPAPHARARCRQAA